MIARELEGEMRQRMRGSFAGEHVYLQNVHAWDWEGCVCGLALNGALLMGCDMM